MTGREEKAALARMAVQVAGDLRLLIERMGDLDWHLHDYTPEQLADVASALRGSALTIALDIGDTDLMNEITGRRAQEIDPLEWLRNLGRSDGEPPEPGPIG